MSVTRVAVCVVTTAALASAGALCAVTIFQRARLVDPEPAPAVAAGPRCSGWLPVVPAQLQMVDVVRIGPDDAWLLTTRGVFRWDGCAWRLQPSREIAGAVLERMRLAVDAGGTAWVRGH